jgi:hypothetical protein
MPKEIPQNVPDYIAKTYEFSTVLVIAFDKKTGLAQLKTTGADEKVIKQAADFILEAVHLVINMTALATKQIAINPRTPGKVVDANRIVRQIYSMIDAVDGIPEDWEIFICDMLDWIQSGKRLSEGQFKYIMVIYREFQKRGVLQNDV